MQNVLNKFTDKGRMIKKICNFHKLQQTPLEEFQKYITLKCFCLLNFHTFKSCLKNQIPIFMKWMLIAFSLWKHIFCCIIYYLCIYVLPSISWWKFNKTFLKLKTHLIESSFTFDYNPKYVIIIMLSSRTVPRKYFTRKSLIIILWVIF